MTWIVASLALAATGLMFARPHYAATAEIILGVNLVGAAAATAEIVESQIETLKSSHIARAAIDKLSLWNDAELAYGTRGLLEHAFGMAGGESSVLATAAADREKILANFKEATTVRRSGDSFVVTLSFTSIDPQKAAAAANALAAAYEEYRSSVQAQSIEQAGGRLEGHIARLARKSTETAAAVDKAKKGNAPQPPATDELRALQSQSQAYRSIYRSLLDRYTKYLQEQASPITEARVISEAVPPTQWSSPNIASVLLLSACAGGIVGLAMAMRKEHVARPVRSLAQIERDIGLPALGIVPLVEGRRLLPAPHQAPPLLLHDRGDALRGIKIAVKELCSREHCVIGVASAFQGEGKSTVAYNLAVLEAESSKRVLLIDANLHRPSLGRSLAHGTLLAPLEGRAALSDSVTRTELGFDFLGEGSGDLPLHPAVLLGSPAMRDLIGSARALYDCVVCDLPNVLGHADVQAAADLFDALVLVTEWGRTPSAAATRVALKSAVISDRLVGVIINKAPLRRNEIA